MVEWNGGMDIFWWMEGKEAVGDSSYIRMLAVLN